MALSQAQQPLGARKEGKMKRKQCGVILVILLAVMLLAAPFTVGIANAASKTLKIGVVVWLGWPLGLNAAEGARILADVINKKGGLDVGGEKYKLEVIVYDSKHKQATAKGAVERLIHRDRVKFIMGDETVDAYLPITDKNKVLVSATTPAPPILDPKYKFCYQGSPVTNQTETLWGWFSKYRSDLKTVLTVAPDNMIGHAQSGNMKRATKAFGFKAIESVLYPPTQKDFSAIGTKVKNLKPDIVVATGGGPPRDSAMVKAAYEAGYRGQFFWPMGLTADQAMMFASAESIEGLVGGMFNVELDDPPPLAKAYKAAYIAKHGKWTDPDTQSLSNWDLILAGIQKARSIDTEKVKAVLDKGMRFPSVSGEAMTIPRLDFGNQRACDVVIAWNIKKITGGKAQKIGHVNVDEAYAYNKKVRGLK